MEAEHTGACQSVATLALSRVVFRESRLQRENKSSPFCGQDFASSRSGKAIHLSVDDNGRGMSEQIRRDLFKAFVTSKTEGLGVGLAVSRSLAEACGGELRLAESSLGGAKLELALPIDDVRGELP